MAMKRDAAVLDVDKQSPASRSDGNNDTVSVSRVEEPYARNEETGTRRAAAAAVQHADNEDTIADTPQRQPVPAFWNVNIPPSQHTKECPPYLQYAMGNAKDRAILSTPDAMYRRQSWEDVCSFVQNNHLDLFQRVPSELRLYREFCSKLVETYGSVREFVMKERLRWTDLASSGAPPFSNPEDYKILPNDWPYGLDPQITHLVIWTKFSFPPDLSSDIGDLSAESRRTIQAFVDRTFGTTNTTSTAPGRTTDTSPSEDVVWFLNWSGLKSVHSVEHFHVLLRDPDEGFVRRITGAEVAWRDRWVRGTGSCGNVGM